MTPDRLLEIRQLLEASTLGPWRRDEDGAWVYYQLFVGPKWQKASEPDQNLVLNARPIILDLLSELERLQALVVEYRDRNGG